MLFEMEEAELTKLGPFLQNRGVETLKSSKNVNIRSCDSKVLIHKINALIFVLHQFDNIHSHAIC
jgi:hypothetical protein